MADALACSHVSKSFGATRAVSNVTVTLHRGQVLALVGENGAGKSTLMKLISGELTPDTGSVEVAPPADGQGRPVAMVHQELSLFGNLTVAENLSLDRADSHLLVDERSSRAVARRTLDELGVAIDVDATVGDLTVGQRQLVEVAKAVSVPPTVLVLDEPTSSLEGPQVELLFAAVRRLSAAGTAVIFISHRMDELFALCDTVLVMRDGQQVDLGDLAERTRHSLVESMVGRETSSAYPPPLGSGDPAGAAPALAVEGVDAAGTLHDVSVGFPAGVVTGVAGLDGHGQSELAEVLAGAVVPDRGTVLRRGAPVRFSTPRDAVRAGIGYIAPDRRLDGLLADKSVGANVLLAAAPKAFRSGFVPPRRERETAGDVVSRLAVRCRSLLQPVSELSGGNQQKVLVGRWLVDESLEVLVLNDPTRGVDVGSRVQIYTVLRQLAARGVAIVLVSTDLQEVLGLSDQVYVMYAGRVTGRLDAAEATESAVMHLATGATGATGAMGQEQRA